MIMEYADIIIKALKTLSEKTGDAAAEEIYSSLKLLLQKNRKHWWHWGSMKKSLRYGKPR